MSGGYIAVGLVLGAFGTDGRVRVRPLTDFPERLRDLKEVRVVSAGPLGGKAETRAVISAEEHGDGNWVLALGGVDRRELAAALHGSRLEIEASQARPLPPGRFYRFQLLDLTVKDESGRVLGRVRDVLETGANDVFVVLPEGGAAPRDEILLPALKDVVLRIDPAAGEMIVRPLPEWGEDR